MMPAIFSWREIRYRVKFVQEKVFHYNREFVISMFVIFVNAYNGKDRENPTHKKLFHYICQFVTYPKGLKP